MKDCSEQSFCEYDIKGYTGDGKPPKMTKTFEKEVANRYTETYKMITGRKFVYSYKIFKLLLNHIYNEVI